MPAITTMPPAKQEVKELPKELPKSREVGADGRMVPKGAKKKPAATPKQTEEVAKSADAPRIVIYPEERAEICKGANAITERDACVILDWLPESKFQSRKMAQHPGTEAGAWAYGDVYMLKDEEGAKVRCLNNTDNRPFDERWCRGLAQTVLKFQWSGSITITEIAEYVYGKKGMEPWTSPDSKVYQVGDLVQMSAGTINGSSVSLSRTGRVESGQHSLCALKLACQMYRAAPKGTYPQWDTYLAANADKHQWGDYGPAPVIETILVTGLSEDRRVLMTVDNCKPRSEMDVFYTSDIFIKERDRPAKRQELSRMLATCVDLFWKRTQRKGYKTHSEVMQMVLDHPKLIKAVEHLFTENSDVVYEVGKEKFRSKAEATAHAKKVGGSEKIVGGSLISNLGVSAGQASCLCYLMGCSASDGDQYRNGKPSPREKGLDWERWDKAKEFWAKLGGNAGFEPVRRALLTKVATVGGVAIELSGTLAVHSKLATLAKAWEAWCKDGRDFTEMDLTEGGCLHLHYIPAISKEVDGKVVDSPAELAENAADFGGIDVPLEEVDGDAKPKTQEEMEDVRKRRVQADEQKVAQMRLDQNATPVAPKLGPKLK